MSGGFGGLERGARRHRAARDAGLAPIKINAVVQRGINDHTALAAGRALPRHRRDRALHRIHGRRQPQRLASRSRSCRRRELLRDDRARAGRSRRSPGNYRGEVAERYAFDDGARRGRLHLLGDAAVLRRLLARAAVVRRLAFTPACSRPSGTDLRGPLRAGASDAELPALLRGGLDRPRGPLQRTARELRRRAEQPLHKIEMHYIGG